MCRRILGPTSKAVQVMPCFLWPNMFSWLRQNTSESVRNTRCAQFSCKSDNWRSYCDSWLKNTYIIWKSWKHISMQLWFRPVLIGIDRFCGVRELQTNDCECWYARWVLHRDYRYMQNPLNFGAWTICQHLYEICDGNAEGSHDLSAERECLCRTTLA